MEKLIKRIKSANALSYYLAIYDYCSIGIAYYLALLLRFDGKFSSIPKNYWDVYAETIFVYAYIAVIIYWGFGLYKSIWKFASFYELKQTGFSVAISVLLYAIICWKFFERMPISFYIFGVGFQFFFAISVRFSYRFIILIRANVENRVIKKNILLIGAGSAGRMILRDVNYVNTSSQKESKIVCIIDDNEDKWERYIDGVQVIGGRNKILWAVQKYLIDEIYIAITNITPRQKRDIISICKETNCSIKQLPNMYVEKAGLISAGNLQNITIEDVLGRDPISLHQEDVCSQLSGKIVLVTGGGGSIGSELCRQISKYHPKQLIIFDIYENNAYDIENELKRKYPELNMVTLIGSVRDARRIDYIFQKYRPDICYHAAAHKHVPLMETSPCEAIKNNVIGTYKTAYAAMKYGCKRFVLISTDKAVNPTNVMGATKRVCEMIVQTFDYMIRTKQESRLPVLFTHADYLKSEDRVMNGNGQTEYVAVRFGNVLGSNGSVVPLFKKQIEAGGPVTITHKDIIRYFMTIPEAVSLVLKAGANASGGEIFVLDMGEPVKIVDLAKNMIELAGLRPNVDIEIEYIGLRPGEKLYEEKLMAEEGLEDTENHLIHVAKPLKMNFDIFINELEQLMNIAYNNSDVDIIELLKNTVPTFRT